MPAPELQQRAHKQYEDATFHLDDRKLSRIIEVSTERLTRTNSGSVQIVYGIEFSNGRRLQLTELSRVLELDNTRDNPITTLDIELFTWSGEGTRSRESAENAIAIVFSTNKRAYARMDLYAWSNDSAWLTETMGALEEQADRCVPTEFMYKIKSNLRLAILIAVFVIGIAPAMLISVLKDREGTLGTVDREFLTTAAASAKTDSEKINLVFEYVRRVAASDSTARMLTTYASDYHSYLVGVPLLLALILIGVAALTCYPSNAFIWGDYAEHFRRLLGRRKLIWQGALGSFLVSVVASLFAIGLSGFGAK